MYGGENVSGCIRRNYPRCGWKNIRYENWLALRAASPQDDRVLQNREAFRRQELESETDPVGIFKRLL